MCLFQMRRIFCSLFIQAEHDMTEMLVFCIKTTNICTRAEEYYEMPAPQKGVTTTIYCENR